MSIAPTWSEFKTYVAEIGPGRGRPARPGQCVSCEGARVWFNGGRLVWITLLVEGQPQRPAEGLPLQRVRCARRACGLSWTLRPPWLYPHRSLELCHRHRRQHWERSVGGAGSARAATSECGPYVRSTPTPGSAARGPRARGLRS